MNAVRVSVTFNDGRRMIFDRPATETAVREMRARGASTDAMRNFVLEALASEGLIEMATIEDLQAVASSWGLQIVDDAEAPSATPTAQEGAKDATPDRRLAKCRSTLSIANRLLPPGEREEALDEWMDEISTAAAKGLPVFRRAASIVLRSLPVMALRSRLPARVRGGGS